MKARYVFSRRVFFFLFQNKWKEIKLTLTLRMKMKSAMVLSMPWGPDQNVLSNTSETPLYQIHKQLMCYPHKLPSAASKGYLS